MMKSILKIYWTSILSTAFVLLCSSCNTTTTSEKEIETVNASMLLGNPDYPAISYGGYRETTREIQPTIKQLKNDLRILHALGYRLLRTYNLQFKHAPNLVKAISELKAELPEFEMYVMLGTWIDCKSAWTSSPDHSQENEENNKSEIQKAVALAKKFPEIIKIIAVGNEAMVHWATSYYVEPSIILKWVNHLQELKKKGELPKDLWITSSDNFASWGGGDSSYHKNDLTQLMQAVDYISMHTYPFHDTHYNSDFWVEEKENASISLEERVNQRMDSAIGYSVNQYNSVQKYMASLNINKPIHIGETGWASVSDGLYGANGSHAADEYKQALFYEKINLWSKLNKVTVVFFSAFDEPWKDPNGANASENNFGLFTVEGKAKYALWSAVDKGIFNGLSREENGPKIEKTYGGKSDAVWAKVLPPKTKNQ